MEGFCFEVQVRPGRPTARVAAKTNNLAAVIGACWSTSVEMAVTRLDPCPGQMKRPSVGGCPATPTDPVMGGTHRATHTTGDVQGWMVLFDAPKQTARTVTNGFVRSNVLLPLGGKKAVSNPVPGI